MKFEIEELRNQLLELNEELDKLIKSINLKGIRITHKKYGSGEIIGQHEFIIEVKFDNDEKILKFKIPFIFTNNIVQCNNKQIIENMNEINNLQNNINQTENEIKLKEIELAKQNNKVLNYDLFAVTTGLSYEYILKTNIYCCKTERCRKICDYLGLYKDKSIVKIAEINKIIEAEYVNDKVSATLVKGYEITDNDISKIRKYMEESIKLFGSDIGKQKHKYFFADKFYDTDFKKTSSGGIMEHKYFDLRYELNLDSKEEMPNIKTIADRLYNLSWE